MLLQVIERDGPYCSGKGCHVHLSTLKPIDIHLHHIIPIKDGGSDAIENLQACCRSCHTKITIQEQRTRQGSCMCVQADAGAVTATTTDAIKQEQVDADAEELEDLGENEEVVAEVNGRQIVKVTRPFSESTHIRQPKKKKPTADDVEDAKTKTAPMRVNERCEKPFNEWLNAGLAKGQAFEIEEWCNGGASEFNCSQEAIWRYLKKRLDLPKCNPINGDLTLATLHERQVVVFKKKPE